MRKKTISKIDKEYKYLAKALKLQDSDFYSGDYFTRVEYILLKCSSEEYCEQLYGGRCGYRTNKLWSYDETKFLMENINKRNIELLKILPYKSIRQIRHKKYVLRQKINQKLTQINLL